MYRKILVGLDGSDSSWRAFDAALWIAKQSGGELHAITVEEAPARSPHRGNEDKCKGDDDEEVRISGDILMNARKRGIESGVEVFAKTVEGHEVRSVLFYAQKHQVDLLVVGRTGHSRNFPEIPGSTATMLMLRSVCSFMAVP